MMSSPTPQDAAIRPAWQVYLLVLAAAFALYAATVGRGPAWQDSGMHQLRVLRAEYTNSWGLALAHPLLIAMGQPLRLLGDAYLPTALSVLSGLGMALAVANVYLLGRRLTGRDAPALVAAGMLAISHTAWWLATIAETYCWVTAGLTAELLLLHALLTRPRWTYAAWLGLVNGLGFSLHNFALLPLPVYATVVAVLLIRRRLPWGALPAVIAAWGAGAGLQLGLILHDGFAGGDWGETIRSALFGVLWQDDVLNSSARVLRNGAMYIVLSWPWLALAPVVYGWVLMPRRVGRSVAAAFGAIAAIHVLFAIRYPVPDQFMFLLPGYALLAVGAAVGIDGMLRLRPRWRRAWKAGLAASIILTPVLYAAAPPVLTHMGRSIRPGKSWPCRDENRYWITPWKCGETSGARFAREALTAAADGSVILPSGMATFPLQVLQEAEGFRTDVEIVPLDLESWRTSTGSDPAACRRLVAGRVAYTVDATPLPLSEPLEAATRRRPVGPLLEIEWLADAP
ncbi:MAG: hypothetical protein GX591_07600 [Planctomycetes bacterium]|nr:hypothetical protein [Planctomycetota bacterium]